MGLERTSAAAATYAARRAKVAGSLDRYGHLMACSKAADSDAIVHQVLANNFGISLLRSLRATPLPSNGNIDKPPIDGATGDTPRLHPGLSLRRDTLEKFHTDSIAVCYTPAQVKSLRKPEE